MYHINDTYNITKKKKKKKKKKLLIYIYFCINEFLFNNLFINNIFIIYFNYLKNTIFF